jgi:hypothetical protein
MNPSQNSPSSLFKLAVICSALAGSVAISSANPNLTNGLVSYWPLDNTNNGVSTPDLQSGYDLLPRSGSGQVSMSNLITVVSGVRSNALSFNSGKSVLLAFISPQNAQGMPAASLPPSQFPSWTLSFWVNGTTANNSGGGQRIVGLGSSVDSSPLWDFAVGGANGTTPTQIDQFVRMNGGVTAQGTELINATGGTHSALNVPWLDGTWHNITYVVNYITNYTKPVVGPITAPANGSLTFTIVSNSIPLDSLATNAQYQVNTNQRYILQQSIDLTLPANWIGVVTQATGGYAGTTFTFSSVTNTNAYYRVVAPALREQQWTIYMDGALMGDSLRYDANGDGDTTEPLGAPVPNSATTSVNYLQNVGNNPGGSDPAAIQPPLGVWKMDTLAFGGLARNGGTGSYSTAALDDIAVWKRALSASEITNYMHDGITNPAGAIPLTINLAEDFPAVAVGDVQNLSWTGANNGTQFTLNPGNINENPATSSGDGSTSVTVTSNVTYTISEYRGGLTVNSSQATIAVSNVNPGWHYIDSFTYLPLGPIDNKPAGVSAQAEWVNPPNGFTLNMLPADVYASSVDGNQYFSFTGQNEVGTSAGEGEGGFAGRYLNGDTISLGHSNTLFFRFYLDPLLTNSDPNQGGSIPDVTANIGLTDKGFRDIQDFDGLGGDLGPAVFIVRNTGGLGGPIDLQAQNGTGAMGLSPGGYSYIADTNNGNANGLAVGHVYYVWMDVQNNDAEVAGGVNSGGTQTNAAYYTVWLQRDDWAARTNLFQDITTTNANLGISYPQGVLLSDRDESTVDATEGPRQSQLLSEVVIAMSENVAPQETNALRFDDFYLSQGTTNSSFPLNSFGSLKP